MPNKKTVLMFKGEKHILETEPMVWECKNCGQNDYPKCNKCVREDGKMVEDELYGDY